MSTLYASHYTDETDTYVSVYQGIYDTRSRPTSNIYPSVKCLGCINMTQRIFHKLAKHPQKVIAQDGPHITLSGYQRRYTELGALFTELNYSIEVLHEMRDVALRKGWDPTVKAYSSLEF